MSVIFLTVAGLYVKLFTDGIPFSELVFFPIFSNVFC